MLLYLFASLLTMLFLIGMPMSAQAAGFIEPNDQVVIPKEVEAFIAAQEKAILLHAVDLNRDGAQDYFLVTEVKAEGADTDTLPRRFLIITRDELGALTLVKQNDNMTQSCRVCGGMLGDPFSGIEITQKGFEIVLSGGSRERWTYTYAFNYSRIDHTWQLVKIKVDEYDITDPDENFTETKIPPRDFGKIDFADFNPDSFQTEKYGQ